MSTMETRSKRKLSSISPQKIKQTDQLSDNRKQRKTSKELPSIKSSSKTSLLKKCLIKEVSEEPTEQQPLIVSIEELREFYLWTEKYKPMNSCEVIGQTVAVNRLKSWLEDWSLKNTDRASSEYSDSSNALDESNACLLVCGPTGSGKTSMIYAVADELKYEVLELNASAKRNGRFISKILTEATQSHHMQRNNELSSQGSQNTIHSYFSSVVNNHMFEPLDKPMKKKPKPKGILSYFQKVTNNSKSSNDKDIEIVDIVSHSQESQDKHDSVIKTSTEMKKKLSIAANSLILFDDIDIMIDDDMNGFWNAFNKINAITKKPIILTATQYIPYIKECVNRLQVLKLHRPDSAQTIDSLISIYHKDSRIVENGHQLTDNVFKCLCKQYDNDIRRCLNELQFGSHSSCDDCCVCNNSESDSQEVESEITANFTVYYNSLLFSNIFENKFKILSQPESRHRWHQCMAPNIDDHYNSIAQDIVESVKELNNNVNNNNNLNKFCFEFNNIHNEEEIVNNECIESVLQYLPLNVTKQTLLLDYCPYISFICTLESLRQSLTSNHSRRSRRFTHHLDTNGLYIDTQVKCQLMSIFATNYNPTIDEDSSDQTRPVIDYDLYD